MRLYHILFVICQYLLSIVYRQPYKIISIYVSCFVFDFTPYMLIFKQTSEDWLTNKRGNVRAMFFRDTKKCADEIPHVLNFRRVILEKPIELAPGEKIMEN